MGRSDEAKKYVASAAQPLPQEQSEEMREEIYPKNILMIGLRRWKTEIARRLAKFVNAPL